MTYDTTTVLGRYREFSQIPEGEPTESQCAWAREAGHSEEALACGGECQNCCMGLVEVVRQFGEQNLSLEKREIELADTQTKAERVGR